MTRVALSVMLITLLVMPARAEEFNLGIMNKPTLFAYEISVIRLALAHAPGDHSLKLVSMAGVSQDRISSFLEARDIGIDLFFSGYSPEWESQFLQVYVPLTRGLLGYRLLVAHMDRIAEFSGINTLKDLQAYTFGSGAGWPDNDYLRASNLRIVPSSYERLWPMLQFQRFDLIHRGIQEIFSELRQPHRQSLRIVPGIALVYRFDYFIYVRADRKDLHDILLTGLLNAYESGAFMEHFYSHPSIRDALVRSDLANRTIIYLRLPQDYQSLRTIPDRFWHDPTAEVLR